MTQRPLILISDDDPLVVSALVRQAERTGLACIADTSSERVCDLAAANRPAVILLDVGQKRDGRDILARLKRSEATRDIQVVMISGNDDPFMRLNCLDLGAADYFTKPFVPSFMKRVARLATPPEPHLGGT